MATDCQLGAQLIATIDEYNGTEFHVDTQQEQELIVEALAQMYRDGKIKEMKRVLQLLFNKVRGAHHIAARARVRIGDPFLEIIDALR